MQNLGPISKKAFSVLLSFVLVCGTSGAAFADDPQAAASQLAGEQASLIAGLLVSAQASLQVSSPASLQAGAQASYTVTTLVQDVTGDGYTAQSAVRQGEVGAVVPTSDDLAVGAGFVVVEHESATLESDGSTEVIVRVDRKNYHMTFNANGGIDGPDAVYARYGSPVAAVTPPTRVGCVFTGWYEDAGCTVAATVPATMPAQDKTYYAGWTTGSKYAPVDVVYWGENADDEGYSYLYSKTVQAEIGTMYHPTSAESHEHTGACYGVTEGASPESVASFAQDNFASLQGGIQDGYVYHWRDNGSKGSGDLYYLRWSGSWYLVPEANCGTVLDSRSDSEGFFYATDYFYKCAPVATCELSDALYAWAASDAITVDYTGNVVNVYYDRTTFTWRFGNDSKTANTHWGSVTAKWGADVSTQFQSVCANAYGSGKTSGRWSVVGEGSDEFTAILTHMGTEDVDYYDNGQIGDYRVRYLLQNIGAPDTPGATEGTTIPGNYTQAYVAFWRSTSFYTTSVDYIDITGFTYLAGPDLGTYVTNGGLNLYYKRNWYTVSLNNGEGVETALPVQYGQNLAGTDVATYVPQRPSSVDSHYHFAGWCQSPEASTPVVDLSAIDMPASNLILYARWAPDTYEVTFSADGTSLLPAQLVGYGTKVTEVPAAPEKEGCTFAGWFYEDATGEHAFDPENMTVTHAMALYAKYSGSEMRGWWVYYRLEGTSTDVARPRWGEALVGRTLDIAAKTGDALYEDYRDGFGPTAARATLEISAEGENTLTFWYRSSTCDLTLTKQVKGLVAPGQAFIFRVQSATDPDFAFDVVVRGAASVTVHGVPVGTYVVVEDTSWSWRYAPDRATRAVDATAGGLAYAVEFTNTYGNARWASGQASATNVRAA